VTGQPQNLRRTVGDPDGPKVYVPELDCEVRTFTDRCADLESKLYQNIPCIMHHVPLYFRGPYRATQLANYDKSKKYPQSWNGNVQCSGTRKSPNARGQRRGPGPCERNAVNRTPFCPVHGGKLHPLDHVVEVIRDPSEMSTKDLLKHGYIDVEDLDDEELLRGMARREDGSWPDTEDKRPMIPKEIYDKMVARLFERANEKFRENILVAVEALATIAGGDAYEASDRIRASQEIITRTLGKPKDTIDLNIGTQTPFEQIISGVATVSREESRKRRALPEGTGMKDLGFAIEGEKWTEPKGSIIEESPVTKDREPWFDGPVVMQYGDDVPEQESSPELTKAALKEKISRSRNRRYAAREAGRDDVGPGVIFVRIWEDVGNQGHRHYRWVDPAEVRIPSTLKARETKKRNRERFK
jgi:hypothetical protein